MMGGPMERHYELASMDSLASLQALKATINEVQDDVVRHMGWDE